MSHLKKPNVIILSPAMDIHTDVQYSEYLEEIQRITGPLSRYQLDQLKELIYRIESRCVIGREDIYKLTHQQRDYSATEHNDATNPNVYSSNLSTTESKNSMSYKCNSAVVVNGPIIIPTLDSSCLLDDESTEKPSSCWDIPVWSRSERSNNIKSVEKTHHETKNGMSYTCSSAVVVNDPIIIPRLDLSCLLDDESTEKPSSTWDIPVWSLSARSNIKSINKPEIEKIDLNILSERQEDNDRKEDVSVDTGYSHAKPYGKNKNHSYKKKNAIEKTHHEAKNGMPYTCSSAVVVNEPIIIPILDLPCLLDDESTKKSPSSWDIPVWSMSEGSNNIKSVEKTYHETENGMSYTCNSSVVVNDEYFEEPVIIPRLDLSCLLDDESTETPSSSWDIPVWSMSERSNNIKSINKPEIEKLDSNILSDRQQDNDMKEDVSVDTGYSQDVSQKNNHVYFKSRSVKKCNTKPYGKNKNHYFNK